MQFKKSEARVVNGEPFGKGKVYYPDGTVFEGTWEQFGIRGHGLYRYPDGQTIEGNFESGRENGRFYRKTKTGANFGSTYFKNGVDLKIDIPWFDVTHDSVAEDDEVPCVVCFTNVARIRCRPCVHEPVYCCECANTTPSMNICPIDRTPAKSYEEIPWKREAAGRLLCIINPKFV